MNNLSVLTVLITFKNDLHVKGRRNKGAFKYWIFWRVSNIKIKLREKREQLLITKIILTITIYEQNIYSTIK